MVYDQPLSQKVIIQPDIRHYDWESIVSSVAEIYSEVIR